MVFFWCVKDVLLVLFEVICQNFSEIEYEKNGPVNQVFVTQSLTVHDFASYILSLQKFTHIYYLKY